MIIYEEKIRVRYAETGVNGLIKPVSAFNYFQDIMSRHCGRMNVSAYDLFTIGFAWVVIRYHIKIDRYPAWNDQITVRTWRYPLNDLYEMRQFEIYDEKAALLMSAKSCWIVVNLASKRPARLSRSLPETMISGLQQPITDDMDAVPEIRRVDRERFFNIRMHDLDFNTHVNNSVYIVWALETVPEDIITQMRPEEIAIRYMGESLYGDRIKSEIEHDRAHPKASFVHRLTSENTKKEITRLKTLWRKF
jgi:medium-chain acyl-[acyl-carrier-protein] hydrolase